MKKQKYYISLYIIIPLIFAGLSIISVLVSYRITQFYMRNNINFTNVILFWTIGIALIAFFCGLLVVWLLLKPVQKFVEKAKRFPVISGSAMDMDNGEKGDEIHRYSMMFRKVTDVLSKVDAKQLFPDIIGESQAMRGLMSQIMKVAPTDSTVLILGESGTGKELVASSIYNHSNRSTKPFVKINCVAIPEELLESELFGHEKGAFTGATSRKLGKFEIADQGTVFLDEIGDMPMRLQAKLLRVLQEKEFDHVGGNRPIKVDVRIIAATNKDLEKMVADGLFREDLYYRINVFALRLPPLKERKEDIPILVDYFLKNAPKKASIFSLPLQMLTGYSWPGNVRELQNVIERAAVISEKGMIDESCLPENITEGTIDHIVKASIKLPESSLDDQLQEIEKRIIVEALKEAKGIQARAAEILGINQRSLWHRVKKHNIDTSLFKTNKI